MLVTIVIAIIFIEVYFLVIYPMSLKRRIIDDAKNVVILDTQEYVFKISSMGYFVSSLLGLFVLGMFVILPGYFLIMNKSDEQNIAIIIVILSFGIVFFLLSLFNIIYLKPRTYIKFKDNILEYSYGYRKIYQVKLNDIKNIDFESYYRSFYSYLIVTTKEFSRIRIDLLYFNDYAVIYAILNNSVTINNIKKPIAKFKKRYTKRKIGEINSER